MSDANRSGKDIKAEFVEKIADLMLTLGENAGKWQKGWHSVCQTPFCAATGKPYSGVNMLLLSLVGMVYGYSDPRWMTFRQMEQIGKKNPDVKMHVKKGEKAMTCIRPELSHFIINPETGKKKWLKADELEKALKEGITIKSPDNPEGQIEQRMNFKGFPVFNVSQIENFPPLETPENASVIERKELLDRFIASSGVIVEHGGYEPHYAPGKDVVRMPNPESFFSTEEYYDAKMHEFYHATGHEKREDRLKDRSRKGYAYEEMGAELFAVMMAHQTGMTGTEKNAAAYTKHWNEVASGGDKKEVFRAAMDACKILTIFTQYMNGEEIKAKWFPAKDQWEELIERQNERDGLEETAGPAM